MLKWVLPTSPSSLVLVLLLGLLLGGGSQILLRPLMPTKKISSTVLPSWKTESSPVKKPINTATTKPTDTKNVFGD